MPRIVIIGCGGAGNNTVNRIHHMGISGVETIAINTDKQHLDMIQADKRILIGKSLTKGLGAGGYPDVGKRAAEMARSTLESLTDTNDLVFVTAGLGGGTGTGSAPVVAKLAKGQGATVIGIVSYPFQVEKARLKRAEDGLEALTEVADTVILIDNNRLKNFVPNLPLGQAFSVMDQLIGETVKGISEIITEPSLINVDDSDVRAVMSKGGVAVMLVGESKQQNKAESVVRECLSNPMLDIDYRGATGSLICITGGSDLTLKDAKEVVTSLTSNLDPHADVIWGTCIRNDMEGKIRVTAIMTGIKTAEIFGTRQSYKAMIPDIEHKRSNPKAVEIPQSRKIQTITNTHFSITSPRKVRPGSSCILDVWAHLEEDRDEILKRIHQSNVDSDQIIRTQGPFDIQKGMKLLIRLEIPELIIENAENFLLWTGKIANTSFLINVPSNQNKGKSIGKVKIFIDGLQIGCIFFELFISNNESPKENIPSYIHLFKKAFISYAHADLDRVLPRIQGIQKAAPHLEIKMDIKDIRSGENWKEKLRDYIQLCDIFYLFWSKNAMVSNCVNKEWQCAYKLKGIDFIDPVPLDSPKEAIPPPELAEKHFDDWILAYSRAQIHSFKENIEGGILEWVG